MAKRQVHDADFRTPGADLPFSVRAAIALGRPFGRRIDLSGAKNAAAWLERCTRRPAVKRALGR